MHYPTMYKVPRWIMGSQMASRIYSVFRLYRDLLFSGPWNSSVSGLWFSSGRSRGSDLQDAAAQCDRHCMSSIVCLEFVDEILDMKIYGCL